MRARCGLTIPALVFPLRRPSGGSCERLRRLRDALLRSTTRFARPFSVKIQCATARNQKPSGEWEEWCNKQSGQQHDRFGRRLDLLVEVERAYHHVRGEHMVTAQSPNEVDPTRRVF